MITSITKAGVKDDVRGDADDRGGPGGGGRPGRLQLRASDGQSTRRTREITRDFKRDSRTVGNQQTKSRRTGKGKRLLATTSQ